MIGKLLKTLPISKNAVISFVLYGRRIVVESVLIKKKKKHVDFISILFVETEMIHRIDCNIRNYNNINDMSVSSCN